jgi:hypothetical protein
MYTNTNTTSRSAFARNVEVLLSLYFSCSCIPVNPKLSYIFSPEFLVVFNRFQCKKYQIFDEKFQILCLYFATCQACVELTLEIQRTICR